MRNLRSCVAALAVIASTVVIAGERQFTQSVQDLKEGQCIAAGYIYEQGELLKMVNSVTKVCTVMPSGGRSLWLSVDQKDLKDKSY